MTETHELRTDNIELRNELFDLMIKTHPKGNAEAQKNFCFSLHESRIETYLKTFREQARDKGIL